MHWRQMGFGCDQHFPIIPDRDSGNTLLGHYPLALLLYRPPPRGHTTAPAGSTGIWPVRAYGLAEHWQDANGTGISWLGSIVNHEMACCDRTDGKLPLGG